MGKESGFLNEEIDGRLQDANTAGSLIWELHIHSFFTIAVMTKSPQSTLYVFDKQYLIQNEFSLRRFAINF